MGDALARAAQELEKCSRIVVFIVKTIIQPQASIDKNTANAAVRDGTNRCAEGKPNQQAPLPTTCDDPETKEGGIIAWIQRLQHLLSTQERNIEMDTAIVVSFTIVIMLQML